MNNINLFSKGINSSVDPSLIKNEEWTFPTHNMRVLNKEGQGYVQSFINGNTRDDKLFGEEFRLSDGFTCLGACEYNGILYIFSHNISSGYGEVGCFPAPKTTGSGNLERFDGFVLSANRSYYPLLNFSDMQSNIHRHPLFTFNKDGILNIVKCIARLNYDDTVNIYFVDHNNIDRVINSGFNQKGFSVNNITYNSANFYTLTSQIPLSTKVTLLKDISTPNLDATSIISGGNLLAGMYFIFLRYVSFDFNKTHFLHQSRGFQVYKGAYDGINAEGGFYDEITDKKITLKYDTLDESYKYYELAYIRYYSDTNNVLQKEAKVVDNLFNTNDKYATIEDNDNTYNIEISELMLSLSRDLCSKAIAQKENVCFKANFKCNIIHDEILIEVAKRITIYAQKFSINDVTTIENNYYDITRSQYKDFTLTYSKESYFGGEIYAFACVFVFDDGSESEAYPLRGIDHYNGVSSSQYTNINVTTTLGGNKENYLGIYRFPSRNVSGNEILSIENNQRVINILNVAFDLSQAKEYLDALGKPNFFFSRVKAIRFLRAKRKSFLEAQGIVMACATNREKYIANISPLSEIGTKCRVFDNDQYPKNTFHPTVNIPVAVIRKPSWHDKDYYYPGKFARFSEGWQWFWGADTDDAENSHQYLKEVLIPIYRGYIPMVYRYDDEESRCYVDRMGLCEDIYAFYSPDLIFTGNNKSLDLFSHIQTVGKTITGNYGNNDIWKHCLKFPTGNNNIYPIFDMAFAMGAYVVNQNNQVLNIADKVFVGNKDEITTANPVSRWNRFLVNSANDYESSDGHIFYYNDGDSDPEKLSNRSLYVLPYVALKLDNLNGDINLDIVNIYSKNPNTLTTFDDVYNIDTEKYYSITPNDFIIEYDTNNMLMLPFKNRIVYGGGDCFVQRTYLKHTYWKCTNLNLEPDNDNREAIGCDYNNYDISSDKPDQGYINRYATGLIISFVTENSVNVAMRNSDSVSGMTFYPKCINDGYWSLKPNLPAYQESFHYNMCYHNVLTEKYWILYNRFSPFNITKHPTRIRHSVVNVPYAYADGYRNWQESAFVDYDINYGEINSLVTYKDSLFSVQRLCTNKHFTNEKKQQIDTSAGLLTIGDGAMLDKDVMLFEYGTLHKNSVVCSDSGIYGVDAVRKVIWMIKAETTKVNSSTFNQYDIGQIANIKEEVAKVFNKYYGDLSDITREIPDELINRIGIVTGVDKYHKEIYFTFHHYITSHKDINDNECSVFPSMIPNKDNGFLWSSIIQYAKYHVVATEKGWYYSNTDMNIGNNPDTSSEWIKINIADIKQIEDLVTLYAGTVIYCDCLDPDIAYAYVVPFDCFVNINGVDNHRYLPTIKDCSDIAIYHHINGNIKINVLPIKCICNNATTFVYDEINQFFLGTNQYKGYLYFNLNNESYSLLPPDYLSTTLFYRNNIKNNILKFYLHKANAKLSWIVNGIGERENTQPYNKDFYSFTIMSPKIIFKNIEYSTDTQKASQPFIAMKYWREVEYMENKWHIPIDVSDIDAVEYYMQSSLAGHWLKVTLTYDGDTEGFIREINTNYEITFI